MRNTPDNTAQETPTDQAMTGDAGLTEQMRIRKAKRDRLLDAAPQRVPYPISVPRDHGLAQVRVDYEHLTAGQETQDVVSVAGRVVFIRVAGKLCFATLQDGDGTRLQVMLSLAEVGEKGQGIAAPAGAASRSQRGSPGAATLRRLDRSPGRPGHGPDAGGRGVQRAGDAARA